MKTFSSFARFLLKSAAVFGLVLIAGAAGVGVAALFAFHEVGGNFDLSHSAKPKAKIDRRTPLLISLTQMERWEGEKIMMDVNASLAANRFVAAGSADQSNFAHADFQSSTQALAHRTAFHNTTTLIPPPLDPVKAESASVPDNASAPVQLTDPGSRYITDARTGRIVGIDGRAGAMAEAQRQQAVLDARRERGVRAALPALPVDDAAAIADLPPPKPDMYPAVRRALPAEAATTELPFDASAEVSDANALRPVRRAEPVIYTRPAAQTQQRIFTLP